MASVSGANIWITGASSGIGRALALQLAEAGNTVFASGRNEAALAGLCAQNPQRLVALACDVSDDNGMEEAGRRLRSMTDSLDMVILNAGTCEYVDNAELDNALFRRVFAVNLFGVVNTLTVAKPLLQKAQRRGHIVGIGSLSTVVGLPRAEAYGASKAAMQYLLDSLRVDLAHEKIDVTVVRPGFVETPMTAANDFPMPFAMDAERAATIILRGIAGRQRVVEFPLRLSWSLKLAALCSGLWYRVAAPRLNRANKL
ncbi:SDR family NAD(P)-dependent oxidoreductase [Exilibacterium tricleocarpae]|uniref:SDR family NAD(P)-dependent oxidoreductase n=1 Tax=Exilibacterium tricleocarpae TaxID=2591008 RepID=A0A545TS81_9GAMM|nr:SDR family NAD(P)-dependent oxidoreductase [Exilibacterium tricleocarpae]TQV80072.1 SDR family NAD(P)-dependent oxidoreductase [Exilibacterium tricleocarpae]